MASVIGGRSRSCGSVMPVHLPDPARVRTRTGPSDRRRPPAHPGQPPRSREDHRCPMWTAWTGWLVGWHAPRGPGAPRPDPRSTYRPAWTPGCYGRTAATIGIMYTLAYLT